MPGQINYTNLISGFNNNTINPTTNNNTNSQSNSAGIIGVRLTPLTVINSNGTVTTQPPKSQQPVGSAPNSAANPTGATTTPTNSVYINKTVQSIIQKYTVECKSKFDELAKIILKLNLCRKELREYDKQFKSTSPNPNNLLTHPNSSASASVSVTRKNSTAYGVVGSSLLSDINSNTITTASQLNRLQSQLFSLTSSSFLLSKANQPRNNCFGCASASIDACITLFRALLCANNLAANGTPPPTGSVLLLGYVKAELCRQGVLEELIYFSLKRNNNLLSGATTTLNSAASSQVAAAGAPPVSANTATNTTATTNAPTNATAGTGVFCFSFFYARAAKW